MLIAMRRRQRVSVAVIIIVIVIVTFKFKSTGTWFVVTDLVQDVGVRRAHLSANKLLTPLPRSRIYRAQRRFFERFGSSVGPRVLL